MTHLPRLLTSSDCSVAWSNQVAPPGLRLASSKDCIPGCNVSRPSAERIDRNLPRNVWPDIFQSFSFGAKLAKAMWRTAKRSGESILLDWCRAAENLVFGSAIAKSAKLFVPYVSCGNKRSYRYAFKTSPIRRMPPKQSAQAPATLVHPQSSAVARIARRTCHGHAIWWVGGSALTHAKA